MATATKNHDATDHLREVNEQVLDSGRKAGLALVDSYEKAGKGIADLQEKVGDESRVEWVTAVTHAQARFTRELTDAYVSGARGLFTS